MVFQVVAVAVVGRSGTPLYTEVFGTATQSPDVVLAIEFLMYASLDVCEEVVATLSQEQQSSKMTHQQGGMVLGSKSFLGDLLQDRSFETWGYQTTAGTRVILATSGSSPKERSDRDAVEQVLRMVNALVSRTLACPFRSPDDHLTTSPKFVESLQRSLSVQQQWGA